MILPFYCLRASIVSVYYRYEVWQGSDCVCGTCVPSEANTGARFDLLGGFQSSCFPGSPWVGADERADRSCSFFFFFESLRGPSLCVRRLDDPTAPVLLRSRIPF